jgi:hypothetical protein
MSKRGLLSVVAAILMGASLIFSGNVSAHNIDVKKAREAARNYARKVRDESGGRYVHYGTNCVAAFPNHNHIARCLIDYQNEEDTKKGVYTCRELIEIKYPVHTDLTQENFTMYGYHASANTCGNTRLKATVMN